MKWLALFSQTGSEIWDLTQKLGQVPDMIMTNNFENKIQINPKVKELPSMFVSAKHDVLMDFLSTYDTEDVVITLHGYLRIVPANVCERHTIYNGHPGFITYYPELKGKDPQVRAWEGKYPIIGSVVHKVTPGVDEGEVISSVAYTNRCESLDELFGLLKRSSLESWIWAFERNFK